MLAMIDSQFSSLPGLTYFITRTWPCPFSEKPPSCQDQTFFQRLKKLYMTTAFLDRRNNLP